MPDHWFFLSYARNDNRDAYVCKFFEDLADEVCQKAALPSGSGHHDVGFLDEGGILHGESWDQKIVASLQSSRVLVCLISRGYFSSEYCGKELQIFRSRINRFMAENPRVPHPPPVIMPVFWEGEKRVCGELRGGIDSSQLKQPDYGEVYAEQGLRNLLKQNTTYHDAYYKFLDAFAERLYQAAKDARLPQLEPVPSLSETVSAWSQEPTSASPARPVPSSGTDTARFVFVAGRQDEISPYRQHIEFYGSRGGQDWKPYFPAVKKEVGLISQTVASQADLYSQILPISDDLIKEIRAAEATNTIVLVVVDPWSIQVQGYRHWVESYDQANFAVNTGVLVVWNRQSDESDEQLEELRAELESVFFRTGMSNTYFRGSISSADELQRELTAAICEVRNRINRKATLFRRVMPGSLPKISGPGARSV